MFNDDRETQKLLGLDARGVISFFTRKSSLNAFQLSVVDILSRGKRFDGAAPSYGIIFFLLLSASH
jgi:hypothetical protein